MKFALCNEIFKEWEIEKQFAVAADIGFDALEIAPFTLNDWVQQITEEQKQRIRQASADTGVRAAGIHWLLVGPTGLHITDPDPEVRENTTAYCTDLVRFGLDIGATYEVVGSPAQRARKEGVTYHQCWEWFKEAMAACATMPGAEHFRVCIEPLAPSTNNNFLFNHLEVVKMCREIDLPNVGVILDTYSGLQTESDLPEAIRETGDLLFHYHCNDLNQRAPGWGEVDFRPIMQALVDIDYQGYCSIEVFDFEPDPREHAAKGLETLKQALADVT
ncbi:MAG: sugar phosphate isomerase/epimerase family protein [Armatimonadota bacterium]|nr:sugar phosphate isomerase/epimerase family protein [Armatimonadota bacterium]